MGEEANYDAFAEDLRELINRHSMEIGSHTPDHILTDYLIGCLRVFDKIVPERDRWYDRGTSTTGFVAEPVPVVTDEGDMVDKATADLMSAMMGVSDEVKAKIAQAAQDLKGY